MDTEKHDAWDLHCHINDASAAEYRSDMPEIRTDIGAVIGADFEIMAGPGAVLTGSERVAIAASARSGNPSDTLGVFASHLYQSPATVAADDVSRAARASGFPSVVETIGIVARLSAADRFCEVMGFDPKPLPDPTDDAPTGNVQNDLKKRRAHVPMPPGPIPVALDLVPSEGEALRAMFGPMYMTEDEMSDPHFRRTPGLDTPQLETIAARISLINECFY